jgi:hypothetical protein
MAGFCDIADFLGGLLWITAAPQALAQEGRPKIRISYPSISIANLALFTD